MNPCENCGHPMTSHNDVGVCLHHVSYGTGFCYCGDHGSQGYVRAVATLPELLAVALHASPGRDERGEFYNSNQARRVGLFAEALLDATVPTATGNALDLCEAWCDRRPAQEQRSYTIDRTEGGGCRVGLFVRGYGKVRQHYYTSTDNSRDAAAKAIMKAESAGDR